MKDKNGKRILVINKSSKDAEKHAKKLLRNKFKHQPFTERYVLGAPVESPILRTSK